MLQLKACPRCGTGDMTIDKDNYGWFWQCIQCSHLEDLPEVAVEQVAGRLRKDAAVREPVKQAA